MALYYLFSAVVGSLVLAQLPGVARAQCQDLIEACTPLFDFSNLQDSPFPLCKEIQMQINQVYDCIGTANATCTATFDPTCETLSSDSDNFPECDGFLTCADTALLPDADYLGDVCDENTGSQVNKLCQETFNAVNFDTPNTTLECVRFQLSIAATYFCYNQLVPDCVNNLTANCLVDIGPTSDIALACPAFECSITAGLGNGAVEIAASAFLSVALLLLSQSA